MDQDQKKEGRASRWDNPYPVERNSQNQSPSEKAVDQNTSTDCLKSSLLNLLKSFDLSIEDLEELSRYPDDQLTPEYIPVQLQAIRKSKLAPKAPEGLPSKSTEKETVPSADGSGPTVKKKVIDYGHKSKYGYNEGPMEANASSTATDESVKGFQTQQPASVSAAASSLISNPKNLTKELVQQAGSQASTPNRQAFPLVNPAKKVPLAEVGIPATVPPVRPPAVPPVPQAVRSPATPPLLSPAVNQPSFVTELMELLRRHGRFEHTPMADPPNSCQTMAGQRSLWKEAEEPFKSPFGVVKASWLPDFSQTEKQEKKLPTSPQMCDYYAVTPRIFPHTCSLCNEDFIDKKDWLQHQNTFLHNENCRRLLQQYPDWAPENPSSPKRHEADRQERHESRQRSASPSPKRSRRSSSGHDRHWTRSRSRSSGRHRVSRPRSRSPSRHSASPCPKHSRCSGSGYARHRTRSRSRSSERHRTSRPRSRSPRHPPSPRRRSRSPRHSSRWSQSSSSKESRRHESRWHFGSPSPEHSRCPGYPRHRTRSRSRSSERCSRSRSRSRSPRRLPSPRHRSRSPWQSLPSSKRSRSSSSKERRSGSSTRSTEGRCAKSTCSQKDDWKRTHSSSDSGKTGRKDLERTREVTPCQKLSANKRRSQEQTCDKLVPEGESHEWPEHSALASLTEKSVLQAMAQLQNIGAADRTLTQGTNSVQVDTSAVSSNFISMIQQVATQVITAVLDSRGASATRASTSLGDRSTQQGTTKSTKGPSPQQGNAQGTKGPSPQQGNAPSIKGPSPQQGSAQGTKGPSPQQGSAKGTKGPSPQQGSAPSIKGPSPQQGNAQGTKGPSPQQGSAPGIKGPSPQQGSAKGTKGPSPQQGNAQGTKGPSLQQGSAKGTKGPSPQQGNAQGTKGPSPQQGNAKSTKAKLKSPGSPCPKQDTFLCSKAKNKPVVSPCVRHGTAATGMDETVHAVDQWPEPVSASDDKAANDSVMGLSPHRGIAVSGKAENQGEPAVSSQPMSIKAETSDVASPGPQPGTSRPCKATKWDMEQKVVLGSIPPCPGEAAVSSQPVSIKTETSDVASPSPQPGTPGPCKAENKDVEQELVLGSIPPCPGCPGQDSKPRVCICGDSLVVSAQKRASSSTVGLQLGLEESTVLAWLGQENMTWRMLEPAIQNLAAQGQTPGVFIFHLQGYDLVYAIEFGEFSIVERILLLFRELLPQVRVIWSEIIPVGIWHGAKRGEQRKKLNSALGDYFKSHGVGVIRHPGLSSEDPELYTDQEKLSDDRLDMFLSDIKNGILAHLRQPSTAAIGQLNKAMKLPPPGLASVSWKTATWEDKVVLSTKEVSSMRTSKGEAAVSSQPVSSKAKKSGVTSPRPQTGTLGICKAKNRGVKQKLALGSVPPCPGEAAVKSQPVRIKAETSGVASLSPQVGTPGPCKAKNQDVEQTLVAGSIPPCPVVGKQVAKPRVWICGDSLVVSAQKWDLQNQHFGQLDWLQQSIILEWHGQEDLTWTQLVSTLQKLAAQGQAPDVLIIHLGENDFRSTPWPELRRIIKKELVLLKEVFPKVRLMWSEMLLQNIRPAEGDASKVEQVLQEVNLVVGGFVSGFGGTVIKHVETSNSFPVLKVDGSGLSHIGLELFLEDIKDTIRAHVLQSSGTASGGLKEGRNVSPLAPSADSASLVFTRQEVAVEGDHVVSSSKEQKDILRTFHFCTRSSGHSSDSPGSSPKPRVWICGDSMVISAQKRASSTAAGSQLGLEQSAVLEWHGQEKLTWIQLLPFVQNLVTWCQAPDALIIHFGGDDLVRAYDRCLSSRMKTEWSLLRTLFPGVRVIWSEVIPQGIEREQGEYCRSTVMNTEMGRSRTPVPHSRVICSEIISQDVQHGHKDFKRIGMSRFMGRSVRDHGGDVIKHPTIVSENPKLYLDEANLSPAGLDIFLEDIRNGILAYVLQSHRATDGGLREGMSLPPPASPSAPAGLASVSHQEAETREDEVVSSTEEASSVQTSTGEAVVSSQPVSIKAETSGVASPSPQPGTSGTRKAEIKDVEPQPVLGNIPHCSGSPEQPSKPCVWICGHSLINAAQERAAATSIGSQLGLEEEIVLEWHGWDGMMWVQLIPFLQDLATYYWPPDVLIIHVGENDLMYTPCVNFLIKIIQRELFLVKELFPNVKVVWSEITPWPGVLQYWLLKNTNHNVARVVKDHGGAVIKHPDLLSEDPEFYTDQGTLSDAGLDMFVEDMKNGILAHLCQLRGKAAGKELKEGVGSLPPASPGSPVSRETATWEERTVSSTEEASSMRRSTREAAASSQPVKRKAKKSGVASSSSQTGMSGTHKDKNRVKKKLVLGSLPPCPGEAAVSSQPVSIKAETSDVASPSLQPGTSGPCKAENEDAEQELVVSIPLSLDKALEAEVKCLGPRVVKKQKSQQEAGRRTLGRRSGRTLRSGKKKTSSPAVPQETSKRDSLSHNGPSDAKAKPPEAGGAPNKGGLAAEDKNERLPVGAPIKDTSVWGGPPSHRIEVTREEVRKQEPSKESPDLEKNPKGAGLVHAASIPSAKPTEAKEEPSSKVVAAEVKNEPSEKMECEAPSKPSKTVTSEGKLAALTTKPVDLSPSEVKAEQVSASLPSLGKEEKVPDKADAELLGSASTSTARDKDQELADPAGELSEELKGPAKTGGIGADPAKTEQGAETAPAICETVLPGSAEAPVEELSGEDLQSNTKLVPPGTDHTDTSRNLPERSASEVGAGAEKEPETPSSAVEGSMEVEPETTVLETTEPAKGKPELQTGKVEAASEKQPEVLISTDRSTQEEKLGKKADNRSREQSLPKSQPRKETGQDRPAESSKAEVFATELAPSAEATSVSKTILKALMSVPNISKKRTVTRRKEEQKPSVRPGTRSRTVAEKKPVPKEASHQRPTNSRSNLPDSKSKLRKSSSQQEQDSQVETKGSSKQTQEQEARSSATKRESSKEKVFAGRNTRSSNNGTSPKEEEELFPFNLDEFVPVDEVTDEVDSPSQPKRNPPRGKRKGAAHRPSSKRRKGKTSVAHGAAEQELSFDTLDEIGEDEGGMAQAAEHLEAVPDPLEAVPDPQVLVTVDKVNDDEELISKVARDPQALVTFDETSEQEDPAAQETVKEADREPALKTEPLVTGNEIGELEELRLNEPLHFETETFSDRREEKEVLEDPGDFLSSQVPEDPSTSVTVGEIDEDNDYQPLVTLDEVTEEDDDFPEGELNFVTVDGIGSKDEEEEKVTVTSTDMVEVVVKTVPETETATAVAETTEGLPWAAKQEETVILDDASPGEKVCPGENLPEEKKASEAQMEVAEKESVAAEIDTQETTLVETEKDEGGEDLEETLKEETEVEAQLAPPVAESTSKLTEQPDNQGSDMEDRQQPSEMESPEEDVEAKATEMDVEGCPEFATPTEQTGDVVTAAPAQEVSVGGRQTAGGEDPEARSERLGQDPGGKEESCSEVTPSQSSEKPEKECLGSRTASSTARPPQETPPVPTQYLLRPPKRPRRQGEDAVGATQSVGHLPGATARKQPRRQAPEPVARKEKGVVVPSTGRTTRAHPHGRGRHPHPQSSADVGTGGRRVSKPSAGTPPLHPGRRPGLRKEAGQGEGGDGLPQEDGAGSGEV